MLHVTHDEEEKNDSKEICIFNQNLSKANGNIL